MLLAASSRYPNQAFRLGDRAWGLQFHIECDAGDDRRLGRADDAVTLDELGYDADAVVEAIVRRAGRRRGGLAAVRGPVRRRSRWATLPDADIPNPGTMPTLPLLGQ